MKKKQELSAISILKKLKKTHLFGFLFHHAEKTKMSFLDKNKSWNTLENEEIFESVFYLAVFLKKKGFKAKDKLVICSDSSPQWVMLDLAAMLLKGVSVPIFPNSIEEHFCFEMDQTKSKFIFLATDSKHDLVNKKYGKVLKSVITFDTKKKYSKETSLVNAIEQGKKEFLKNSKSYEKMGALNGDVKPKDVVTIVYTSGTTGMPKGVVLSNENLMHQVKTTLKSFDVNDSDKVLSCLPLAHIFQRTINYYYLCCGVDLYFADDIKNVANLMRELSPTVTTLVPRFLEKVFEKMSLNVSKSTGIKKIIGSSAFKRATRKDPFSAKSFFDNLYDKLVYSKLRQALGGNLRLVVSGGAELKKEIYKFFLNIGVPTYQGYGLTETSPVVSSNSMVTGHRIGSVGRVYEGLEVQIAEDKEILVKGKSIMQGYYLNKKETDKILKNKWFHTGDLGLVDKEGFLFIIGRKKEQFKLSNGKYVMPVPIEGMINGHPMIEQSIVIADGKKFVSAIVFFNPEMKKEIQGQFNIEKWDEKTLQDNKELRNEIFSFVRKQINPKLDSWQRVKEIYFSASSLSPEKGELTTKMSLCRPKIETRFAKVIKDFQ